MCENMLVWGWNAFWNQEKWWRTGIGHEVFRSVVNKRQSVQNGYIVQLLPEILREFWYLENNEFFEGGGGAKFSLSANMSRKLTTPMSYGW